MNFTQIKIALVTCIVIIICLILLGIAFTYEDGVEHTKNITITDTFCYDNVLGENISKVRTTEETYFINNDLCNDVFNGDYNITYIHVHNRMSLGDYDFFKIIKLERLNDY